MIIIKLRELLWQMKITGKQLAHNTNISEATISKLVRGDNIDVKISTLNKICGSLHCSLNDLVEYRTD